MPHGRVGQRPAGVRDEEGRVPRLPVTAVTGRRRSREAARRHWGAGAPAGTCGTWSGGSVRTPASRSTSAAPRVRASVIRRPGAGQQPDQGGVGLGAQPVGRGERPGRLEQRGDVGLGVDERRPAGMGRAEQAAGRDLGARLAGGQVPGQRPHHLQPPRLIQPGRLLRQASPAQGDLGRQRAAVPRARRRYRANDRSSLPLDPELVAQRPAGTPDTPPPGRPWSGCS